MSNGIWVRSQKNGALRFCTDITVEESDICLDIPEQAWCVVDSYGMENARYLGTYPTESRALEVLGQLENEIWSRNTDNVHRVYHMPKE